MQGRHPGTRIKPVESRSATYIRRTCVDLHYIGMAYACSTFPHRSGFEHRDWTGFRIPGDCALAVVVVVVVVAVATAAAPVVTWVEVDSAGAVAAWVVDLSPWVWLRRLLPGFLRLLLVGYGYCYGYGYPDYGLGYSGYGSGYYYPDYTYETGYGYPGSSYVVLRMAIPRRGCAGFRLHLFVGLRHCAAPGHLTRQRACFLSPSQPLYR